LNLGGITAGNGLTGFYLDYRMPLAGNGLSGNLKYSRIQYKLGEYFATLDAAGTADITGLGLRYPLLRSRKFNLYGELGFDYKDLHDDIALTDTHTPRVDKLWNLGSPAIGLIPGKAGLPTPLRST
jgi:hemolysin activation/secretion protein